MTTPGVGGWFPDPTPERVVAPGWGTAVPVPSDPLVEVGWWALVGLDLGLSAALSSQVMQFGLIRTMALAQAAASSQSMTLQKIAALQFSGTATPTQTLAMQRVVSLTLANTSAATQALGLVKVIGLALDATGAGAQALGLTRVGVLALSQTAPALTAMAMVRVVSLAMANTTAPASQVLATIKIAMMDFTSLGTGTPAAVVFNFPAHAEETTTYNVAGTYSYPIPRWCDWVDVIPLGGGEAGTNGGAGNGSGGQAGHFNAVRWTRGSLGIPFDVLTLDVVVAALSGTNGSNGNPSSVSWVGGLSRVGDGGSGQMGATVTTGQAAGTLNFNGVDYVGGLAQNSLNGQGRAPGGGGAGGGFASAGGRGAIGCVWLRAGQG